MPLLSDPFGARGPASRETPSYPFQQNARQHHVVFKGLAHIGQGLFGVEIDESECPAASLQNITELIYRKYRGYEEIHLIHTQIEEGSKSNICLQNAC